MDFIRILRGIAVPLVLICACAPALAQSEAWHTYTDAAHGFSISYPDGWTVNPQFSDKGYAYSQGDSDDVRYGTGLSPSIDLAPGTNLESRQLVLAVQFARPGDTCKASAFLADPSPDYFTQVLEDSADNAHTEAEPGDLYSVEHIVHVVSHSPCIAMQVYLVTAKIHPHDAGPPKPVDRTALFALLGRIAMTLKALK